MKRQTRAFLLNIATAIAVAATAALVFLPSTASAATYYATEAVNLRDVPNGTVIGRYDRGMAIDVIDCDGTWCHVNVGGGAQGYVAQSYLSANPVGPAGSIEFGVTGPNGNTIQFGINTKPVPPDDDDEPIYSDGEACFYERTSYRGGSFCVEAGDQIPDLGGWSGDISSIENPDGLDVTVCTRTRLRGDCRTYTTSSKSLGRFDNVIKSLSVD